MKIENLIKYWRKFLDGLQEDDKLRQKHFGMIEEALKEYKRISEIDISVDVKITSYDAEKDLASGLCKACKFSVNSEFDFCPHCGRPLKFNLDELKVHKKSTTSGHRRNKKGEKNG